jgi:hypothetical protein
MFNLTLGGLGIVGLLCFGALIGLIFAGIGFFSLKGGQLLPPAFVLHYVSFNAGLVLLTSGLLLISGIGLFKMKAWGRWIAIVTGGVAILAPLAGVLFNIAYFNPAMEKLNQTRQEEQEKAERSLREQGVVVNPRPQRAGPSQAYDAGPSPEANPMVSVFALLPGMVYGAILLGIMLLPKVSAAFSERRVARVSDS